MTDAKRWPQRVSPFRARCCVRRIFRRRAGGRAGSATVWQYCAGMHTARRRDLLGVLSIVLVTSDCQQSATSKQGSASSPAKTEQLAAPDTARFASPRAVYKQYAEMLNASRWADAIAVFSQTGKPRLALENFKALAVLAGKQHPKQEDYKAVLHDFCQGNRLRCADESWNAVFTPTLLRNANVGNVGNVTNLLSDVASLAAAKPEATYVEVMKLLKGVDPNSVMPLDPTLSQVIYTLDTATGIARRADGETSTMSFASSAERGWMIVE